VEQLFLSKKKDFASKTNKETIVASYKRWKEKRSVSRETKTAELEANTDHAARAIKVFYRQIPGK
jgi:hypothetical protein